jgi:hypothetical protein
MNTISDHAWTNGYQAAVTELQNNCSVMLDGIPRMTACITVQFDPIRPFLLSHEPMFFDDWDAGYERAILLWRLGVEPAQLADIGHILSKRTWLPLFEGIIRFVLDGDMRIEPRIWKNRKGQFLQVRHGYQKALDMVYHDYTERYQQVRAAHLLLVEKECQYCANSIDECTCKEVTKPVVDSSWYYIEGVRYCSICRTRRCVRQCGGRLPCVKEPND